jgi:hypothetical protein
VPWATVESLAPLSMPATVDRVSAMGVGVRDLDPDVEGCECVCC